MKTPDEIKKGLEHCINGTSCRGCPYCEECAIASDCNPMHKDLQEYVQQLEAELRDAKANHQHTIDIAERQKAQIGKLKSVIVKMNKEHGPCWISVEERLPGSDCDWVLAIGKFVPENTYGKPIISELRKDGKWWGDINDEFPLEDMGIRITHWMPLPKPPEESP